MFRRSDLSGEQGEIIRLSPYLINDTRLSSTIVTEQGVRVGTIEHIMSALAAYGVDNVLIELSAPEIPIMDGSSLPFLYLLQDAGIVDQKAQKRFLKIIKPVEVKADGKWVKFTPHNGFKVTLTIESTIPYSIAARRLSKSTLPANRMWTKSPVPALSVSCRKWK